MIKRSQWGAKPVTAYNNTIPLSRKEAVVIHHSVTAEGTTQAQVEATLRRIDDQHRGYGWGGIGYNLAVDYNGTLYEARGIDIMGAHAYGMNTKGYGICYIGDGRKQITEKAVATIKSTIEMLQLHAKKQLRVIGHRDINSTQCPGSKIYSLIESGSFNVQYQVAPVKPVTPKPQAPATGTMAYPGRFLKKGEPAGPAVLYLQNKLGVNPTGPFGPMTHKAVVAFQKKHGLLADGIVGPLTWSKLGKPESVAPVKLPVKPQSTQIKPQSTQKFITAVSGDSYWRIAVKQLGVSNTPIHYPKIIRESNRIKDLNKGRPVSVGQKVQIS